MEDFVEGYLAAAMFTSQTNLPAGRYEPDFDAVPDHVHADAVRTVQRFLMAVPEALRQEDWHEVGRHLWYTRNGHGTGFWDGSFEEPFASAANKYAESLGEDYETVADLQTVLP